MSSGKLGLIAKFHNRGKNQQIDVFIKSELDKIKLDQLRDLDLSDNEKLALQSLEASKN